MASNNSSERSITAKQVAAGILAILVIVFILENTHHTNVRFIIPKTSAPLWLALLLSAAVGACAGALFVHRRSK